MLKHKTTTTLAITALAAALAALVVGPSAGAATTQITTCAQVVTTSAFLAQDLSCAGAGVVVGASGITIDLNGHVLKGDRSFGDFGVDDSGGHDVMVKNGVIRNFDDGVFVFGGFAKVSISNVVSTGNARGGLVVNGDRVSINKSSASGNGTIGVLALGTVSVTSTTAAGNGTYGVWLAQADGSSVRSSRALGNGSTGFVLEGDSTSVISSTASGNGGGGVYIKGNSASVKSTKTSGNAGHGIEVSGDAALLRGNSAQGTGFLGGVSDGIGLGILVGGFSIAPTGTNLARGNDDPAECSPASLCPAGSSAKAAGTPITTCAQVVTTDAVLTQNLDCVGHGIVVGASGITINLNAHVLKGDGSHYGIDDGGGFDDITIENGVVRSFGTGVNASTDARNVTISNVVASGNTAEGIYVSGSSASIQSSTASGNQVDGIELFGDSLSIKSSTAAGNAGNGIYADSDVASVTSSSAVGNASNGVLLKGGLALVASLNASGNGYFGLEMDGGSASIKSTTTSGNASGGMFLGNVLLLSGSRAEGNGFPGGASDGVGLGIQVNGLQTGPVSKNIFRGNDNPAECNPSWFC
jgi:hypothetical protein